MSCEKLSKRCDEPTACWCDDIRSALISDTGLRTLARERGLTVLTGAKVDTIRGALLSCRGLVDGADSTEAERIRAAMRELEGSR